MYIPHLVFLSEPQIFQSDLSTCMDYFRGEYSFTLNSEDSNDPDIALLKTKSKGGTLAMWRQSLDPFVTIIHVDTSALLPVLLEVPNFQPSIHIGLYLPTAGKETEYLMELSKLSVLLDDLDKRFPTAAIFIRGDANSSQSNQNRHALLTSFCQNHMFNRVTLGHNTYHHFMGAGKSDSELDVLLYSSQSCVREDVLCIECKQLQPLVILIMIS